MDKNCAKDLPVEKKDKYHVCLTCLSYSKMDNILFDFSPLCLAGPMDNRGCEAASMEDPCRGRWHGGHISLFLIRIVIIAIIIIIIVIIIIITSIMAMVTRWPYIIILCHNRHHHHQRYNLCNHGVDGTVAEYHHSLSTQCHKSHCESL